MNLFVGLLFSSVGGVLMVYGKRQHESLFLVSGFVLAVYPYFVTNTILIVIVGLILIAIPVARHKGYF